LVKAAYRLRVGIHQPPAEPPRRTEGAPEDLQSASQQFCVEVLVARDFYSDQFVPGAPLHGVSEYFFRALPSPWIGFRLVRFHLVIHSRVEIPLPFKPLANIPF